MQRVGSVSERVCGPREDVTLRKYQAEIAEEILDKLRNASSSNVFVSLPQGTGKTIIALNALCELINGNSLSSVLILIPRTVLVDQWVERSQEKFYGIGLLRNPTLAKENIHKIRGWLKHGGAKGIAMTDQSFKGYIGKGLFSEDDFDLVVVDEAADLVISKDFVEGFRMSAYLQGLEKWAIPKIFLLPYHVPERKIAALMKKFGKTSQLIRREIEDETLEQLQYTVQDPIVIQDPLVDDFVLVLFEHYKKIRTNVNRILNKYGIEGYRENLETLLNTRTLDRFRRVNHLDEDTINQIVTMIAKYIQMQHIMRWFLYSNREDINRSILSAHSDVKKWLSFEDKKLAQLVDVVRSYLDQDFKIYIYSQYVATAKLIAEFLSEKLNLKSRDLVMVSGLDEDQYIKLDSFKKVGKILVATPVFDKGTDIPQADTIIVYTPPYSAEKLFQVVGRIRGGEVVFLAYSGYEHQKVAEIVGALRKAFQRQKDEKFGTNSNI